jgi:amino acid adenylation domain-containing protein
MQAGLVFETLTGRSGVYVQQVMIDLRERVDVDGLERSWRAAVARNWALRSSFEVGASGPPLQRVHAEVDLPVTRLDWTDLDAAGRERRWSELVAADRSTAFDPADPPLLRLVICRLGAEHVRLLWTYHHAILDGRSRLSVLREVFGGDAIEGPGPEAFAEFAAWANGLGDDPGAGAFWTDALAGCTTAPSPRDAGETGSGGDASTRLDADLSASLRDYASRNDVTLATVLQGAFALVLAQEVALDDVVYGTTRAGRRSAPIDADALVGMLMVTSPVRTGIDLEARVVDWLREIRAWSLAVRPYEHVSLLEIQGLCRVPPSKRLIETLFSYENATMKTALAADDRAWERRDVDLLERLDYGLSLSVYGDPGILVKAHYDGRGTSRGTAERFVARYETVLREVAASPPDALVGDLGRMPDAERRDLSGELLDFAAPSSEELAPVLFARRAAEHPERVALETGDERLTYGELGGRVDRLARHLIALGAGREVRVGVALGRSVDLVVAALAAHRAGAGYVPLDPAYPPERLRFMVEDCGARVVLTDRASAAALPTDAGVEVVLADADPPPADPAGPLAIEPADLSHVIYTSGSTGRPKGVAIEHEAVAALTRWAAATFSDAERDGVLFSTSLSFDLSVFELVVTLALGGRVVLVRDLLELADPGFAPRVTHVNSVPSVLGALVHDHPLPASVTTVSLAGEPLTQPLVDRLHAEPGVERVWNLYGPSEDTTFSTAAVAEAGAPGTPHIGRPIPGTQAYVLDRALRPLPIGAPGELYLGGAGLARGYLDRPELTAERFVSNPFADAPSPRLYRTGDAAAWRADGQIDYRGRLDDQVKLRGFRIEPGEIRAALLAADGAADAAVVVRGKGDARRLVAYVVAQPEAEVDEDALRRRLEERLPAHMVPSAVVPLDALPVTHRGKLDADALPAPTATDVEPHGGLTATEASLAAIWRDLLGLDSDPGPDDDFFALGGHSLLALRLLAAVENATGYRPAVAALYRATTLREFAAEIEAREAEPATSTLIPVRTVGSRPPWFCVLTDDRGVVAMRNVLPALLTDQPVYALQAIDPHDRSWRSSTMAALAARCIEAVRKLVPEGPYRLGGHSLGGLVAFEMANQLEEAGAEVELLTLLDTGAPHHLTRRGRLALRRRWPAEERRFPESERPLGPIKWYGDLVLQEWHMWRHARARDRSDRSPPRLAPDAMRGFEDPFDAWGAARLGRTMKPRRLRGRVVVLRLEDTVERLGEADLGWGRYTASPPEMIDGVGGHQTLLSAEYVTSTALAISEALRSVDGR